MFLNKVFTVNFSSLDKFYVITTMISKLYIKKSTPQKKTAEDLSAV